LLSLEIESRAFLNLKLDSFSLQNCTDMVASLTALRRKLGHSYRRGFGMNELSFFRSRMSKPWWTEEKPEIRWKLADRVSLSPAGNTMKILEISPPSITTPLPRESHQQQKKLSVMRLCAKSILFGPETWLFDTTIPRYVAGCGNTELMYPSA
jgi:hypothetical protein